MNEIIPTINGALNLDMIKERLSKLLGLVGKVQLDVVDGKYAPVLTWPFAEKNSDDMVKIIRGEKIFPFAKDFVLQIDMMVLHPIEYLTDFLALGAKSFVIHIDSTDHIQECIDTIKNSNCEVGIGIKPSVDADLLDVFLPQIDFIQFMGNDRVGHSGTELDPSVINKIKYFHKKHPSMPIQIDIGVSEETISELKESGVTSFISSSSIFNSTDPESALKRLQNI
jgi:ribulose-phosphate 3-epimerase